MAFIIRPCSTSWCHAYDLRFHHALSQYWNQFEPTSAECCAAVGISLSKRFPILLHSLRLLSGTSQRRRRLVCLPSGNVPKYVHGVASVRDCVQCRLLLDYCSGEHRLRSPLVPALCLTDSKAGFLICLYNSIFYSLCKILMVSAT
jgi:hypothetical protein